MTTELPSLSTTAPKATKQVVAPEQLPVFTMPSESEQIIADLDFECRRDHEIGDVMLTAIVTEKRNASFAEQTFFKGRLAWDDRETQRQVNRMANILRSKSIAGSSADRQAAIDEQAKSAEILHVEGPKLDDAIRKLQEQKDALEKNSVRAARVCEQIGIACESLRSVDFMRADLKAKYNGKRREFGERDWSRLGAVGTEVSFRQQMLSPVEDSRKFVEALGIHFPDCRTFDEHSGRYVIANDVWEARKGQMRCELIELQDEFDRLTALKNEQLLSLQPLRDHYLMEEK